MRLLTTYLGLLLFWSAPFALSDVSKRNGVLLSTVKYNGQTISGGSSPTLPTDDLIHRWTADAGVEEATGDPAEDGDTVEYWLDQVGSLDLSQATSGDRPVYRATVQNSLPGVEFVSDDLVFTNTAAMDFDGLSFYSVYVVAESDVVDARRTMFWNGDKDQPDEHASFTLRGDVSGELSVNFRLGGAMNYQGDTSTYVSAGTPYYSSWLFTNGSGSNTDPYVRLDGAGLGSGTAAASGLAEDRTAIGASADSSIDAYWDGHIFEILIYDVAHTTEQREAVEDYLASRWGL